nr:MAG: elongation factor P [Hyphomicrobiales bacterium]
MGCPPWRRRLGHSSILPPWPDQFRLLNPSRIKARFERKCVVSVIASSIRKGNVVEREGKLYVVLRAENIHPGKGTPVTHLEMRRISDGVKVNDRFKTTASVEKAFIDSGTYNYLYQDGDSYVFMEPNSFEQLSVPADVIGDSAVYLQENMQVSISQYNGIPISIELPARVVLEVVETEPVVKGQTASSSFKPALLANGVRTGVPPHISAGTRVVVQTDDGAYLERAKD